MSWQAKELGIDLDTLKREMYNMSDDWIGVARAANRFNVSTQTIYRYVAAKKLISEKNHGRLWLSVADLNRVFANNKAQANG